MQPFFANVLAPLIAVFEATLQFFHDAFGIGWGLAIIALTLIIRSLLLPLTLKQMRSIYRMTRFMPEIKQLRAFHERVRARRGAQVAAVATARKLASLFWCLLTREQDYAFAQPSLTRRKIRQLELAAGAPSRKGQVRAGAGASNNDIRDAERALALQAESAYRRTISDWKATGPAKAGASVTPGRASQRPSKGKAARQTKAPDVCASLPSIARAHDQDPTGATARPAP